MNLNYLPHDIQKLIIKYFIYTEKYDKVIKQMKKVKIKRCWGWGDRKELIQQINKTKVRYPIYGNLHRSLGRTIHICNSLWYMKCNNTNICLICGKITEVFPSKLIQYCSCPYWNMNNSLIRYRHHERYY